MRFESRTVQTYFGLLRAADAERLQDLRAELDAIRLYLKARREEKYSPDQPRDWHGRRTNGGGGAEQNTGEDTSTNGEAFGTTPDGTAIEPAGTSSFDKNQQ